MAFKHRESIEEVKAEAERLTKKRIKDHEDSIKEQRAEDAEQEATHLTKEVTNKSK